MPKSAIPGPEASTQALSDETLQSLDTGSAKVSGLSKADKYALANHLMGGAGDDPAEPETPSPEIPTESPAEGDKPAAPAEETTIPEDKAPSDDDEKPAPKDRKYWKNKSIQEANERNTLKQQLEATQRRLKAFEDTEAAAKLVKADKPLDPYDDADMSNAATRLAQLEKELAGYREHFKNSAKTEVEATQESLRKKETEAVFTEIGRAQDEFEDLRTEKPFEKLNAEYATWLDRLAEVSGFKEKNPNLSQAEARSMARELYNEDEDFRREALAKKAKPPKELDKIETILTIHEKKIRDGGGFRANYLDHLAETGALPNVIARREAAAALKGSNAAVAAMARGAKGAEQLTPNDGSSKFPESSGPDKMQAYLKDLRARTDKGHRMTAEEKATAYQYMELLSAGG